MQNQKRKIILKIAVGTATNDRVIVFLLKYKEFTWIKVLEEVEERYTKSSNIIRCYSPFGHKNVGGQIWLKEKDVHTTLDLGQCLLEGNCGRRRRREISSVWARKHLEQE